jgi:CheY-like chemotaxis protein
MKALHGYSILIVETDLNSALDLQEKLTNLGARVLTAYGADRALLHAESTRLSAAVVGKTLGADVTNLIYLQLLDRRIPVMRHDELDRLQCDPHADAPRKFKATAESGAGGPGQYRHPSLDNVYSNC